MHADDILDAPVNSIDNAFTYPPVWRRIVAALIDVIIAGSVNLVMLFSDIDIPYVPYVCISMSLSVFYYVFFIKNNQATPGKMLLRMVVVKTDGTSISWSDAAVRYIVPFLNNTYIVIPYLLRIFFPTLRVVPEDWIYWTDPYNHIPIHMPGVFIFWWYAIGVIVMALSRQRRATHDFIASTVVIQK